MGDFLNHIFFDILHLDPYFVVPVLAFLLAPIMVPIGLIYNLFRGKLF